MIQAKCIEKFRDKTGKIYGYRLQDINGQRQDVQSENLKTAIRNKQIHIVNLTLTADNRLVDSSEKQLQAKILGKAPITPSNKYEDVAKALTYLDKELIGMGDSYEEVVENRGCLVGQDLMLYSLDAYYDNPEYKNCKDDGEILDKILQGIYIKLVNDNSKEIANIIESWSEYDSYETFETNIKYENVSKITQSVIYKALYLVYKYAKEKKFSRKTVEPLKNFLTEIKRTGIASINLGYNVSNLYYRYLDSKVFGTISNDVFTVGDVITASDIDIHKEYKGYSYVFHKDISRCGAPELALAAFFKNTASGDVQIDIKLGRRGYLSESGYCVSIVGYIKDIKSTIVKADAQADSIARQIAKLFNELGPQLYKLADTYQSLYSSKEFNAPLEDISGPLVEHTGVALIDLAISRWTKIRGDKTPAKVEKILSKSDTEYKAIYSNNVSNSGRNIKLAVDFSNGQFSIYVLDANNNNKVLDKDSKEITKAMKDSSAEIAEVLTEAMIGANVNKY